MLFCQLLYAIYLNFKPSCFMRFYEVFLSLHISKDFVFVVNHISVLIRFIWFCFHKWENINIYGWSSTHKMEDWLYQSTWYFLYHIQERFRVPQLQFYGLKNWLRGWNHGNFRACIWKASPWLLTPWPYLVYGILDQVCLCRLGLKRRSTRSFRTFCGLGKTSRLSVKCAICHMSLVVWKWWM